MHIYLNMHAHTHTHTHTHTLTHALPLIEFDDNWVVSVQSVRALWIFLVDINERERESASVWVIVCVRKESEREREMAAFNGRLVALQCSPNVHVIDIWPCTQLPYRISPPTPSSPLPILPFFLCKSKITKWGTYNFVCVTLCTHRVPYCSGRFFPHVHCYTLR